MSRERKLAEPHEAPGAPEWMVTFSDCMTLLLTFFVLLLSFSSFDEQIFQRLKVLFANALPSINQSTELNEDAFLATQQIKPTDDLSEGSEKPTLEQGKQDNLKAETEPVDLANRKVFLISSQKIFWGKGTVLSLQGREVLATIASFLKEVPSRVVISENGSVRPSSIVHRSSSTKDEGRETRDIGLSRAWAVTEFFVKKKGLEAERFSISAASTVPQENFESGKQAEEPKRVLEIVLLERSIYR